MAYIYGLRDVGSDTYFYIGSTKHPIKHRLYEHLDSIKRGINKNRHLVNKVNKVGFDNVVIDLIEEVDELTRFDREYEIIHLHLVNGVALTNVIVSQRDFEMSKRLQEFDEFLLQPYHIEECLKAYECGLKRTSDKTHNMLAKVIEDLSVSLIEDHTYGFLQLAYEAFARTYDRAETNRQTADIYIRVSEMLERNRGSKAGGI